MLKCNENSQIPGIGYACVLISVPGTTIRRCLLKNANEDILRKITMQNLTALDRMLDYNIRNGISLFRISSDIIPFGSHEVNRLNWVSEFSDMFLSLKEKIKNSGIRISIHPGQYTVLNSIEMKTVKNAEAELLYSAMLLDALGTEQNSKIIIHAGSATGGKKEAVERFCNNFLSLPGNVKSRIVLENDENVYNAEDVLDICSRLDIPAVFDVHHHILNNVECIEAEALNKYSILKVNNADRYEVFKYADKYETLKNKDKYEIFKNSDMYEIFKNADKYETLKNKDKYEIFENTSEYEAEMIEFYTEFYEKFSVCKYISDFGKTWKTVDGKQKIHYSQGRDSSRSHSATIAVLPFIGFINSLVKNGDNDNNSNISSIRNIIINSNNSNNSNSSNNSNNSSNSSSLIYDYKGNILVNLDIMLETKDKNISAIKCRLCLMEFLGIPFERKLLEEEWARYKYFIMDKSEKLYRQVGKLFSEGNCHEKPDRGDGKLYSERNGYEKLDREAGRLFSEGNGYENPDREAGRLFSEGNGYEKLDREAGRLFSEGNGYENPDREAGRLFSEANCHEKPDRGDGKIISVNNVNERMCNSNLNVLSPLVFYSIVEKATALPKGLKSKGASVNAAEHVFGYLKKLCTEKEKKQYRSLIEKETPDFGKIKNLLLRLSQKYDIGYLIRSYYFID